MNLRHVIVGAAVLLAAGPPAEAHSRHPEKSPQIQPDAGQGERGPEEGSAPEGPPERPRLEATPAAPPDAADHLKEHGREVQEEQEAQSVRGLGRLHHPLVHLPIGWLLVVDLFELLAWLRRRQPFGAPAWLLVATVLSFLPAALTGLAARDHVQSDPVLLALAGQHAALMIATWVAVLLATLLRWRLGRRAHPGVVVSYRALLLFATTLMVLGGHLGGRIAFGDG